ncbi:Lysosomal acid lipase/cholesteryl ester hydrolase [Frankliniella fusca]|uniref:Lysosomal acid lipase/cholesteryl ester hydrolase n=1 Tax=Frankliniella fusca TaxID=407009 RepID=A0AAE1HIZ1_9NEOP|nr:Lysosomal acid lipase/cholesteryl ester hydrolase [Frankliniella fusca]
MVSVLPLYGAPEVQTICAPLTASPNAAGRWNVSELTDLQCAPLQLNGPSIRCSPSLPEWDVGQMLPPVKHPVKRALFLNESELDDNELPSSITISDRGQRRPGAACSARSPDIGAQIDSQENYNILDSTNSSDLGGLFADTAGQNVSRFGQNTPTKATVGRRDSTDGNEIFDITDTPYCGGSFESSSPAVNADRLEEVAPNAPKKRRVLPRKNAKKRIVVPGGWAQEKAKVAFNAGVAHVTPKGAVKLKRKMRAGCHLRCRKCKERVSQEERELIFTNFWKLASVHRKRDYITRAVTTKKPQSCSTTPARARKSVRCYTLTIKRGIQDCWVETALKKRGDTGLSPDKRGKHGNRPHRISEDILASVRRHINLFPRVPSHYTREKSKREYLEPHIKSVERMHRIYVIWAKRQNIEKIATLSTYRKVFNQEFNLGFFMPKKTNVKRAERRKMVKDYATHLKNKKLVRQLKKQDKASADELKCVACFDLQKVLPCPRSETSVFFYCNKLSLYNFTVFDLRLMEGHCYLWTEVDALKGSNEIGSNLYNFISGKVEEGVKEFVFWSDSPTGQNRNRMIFCMHMLAAARLKVKITHRVLESGHSYSEADSMHARIELEAQMKEILTPDEWIKLIKEAKQDGKPYIINRLENENVSDLHYLVDRQNWEKNTNKEKVQWSKVREVVTDWKSPSTVFYRYNFTDQLKTVKVTMKDGIDLGLFIFAQIWRRSVEVPKFWASHPKSVTCPGLCEQPINHSAQIWAHNLKSVICPDLCKQLLYHGARICAHNLKSVTCPDLCKQLINHSAQIWAHNLKLVTCPDLGKQHPNERRPNLGVSDYGMSYNLVLVFSVQA